MHKGARFYRCDFQVHSPRDPQWQAGGSGGRPSSSEEREAWARRLIQACRRVGLDAIAITDHHDTVLIRVVRAAAEAELDPDGQRVSAAKRIVVFPGMELTLSLPCQALLLFDADIPLEFLDQLPGALGYEPAPATEPQAKQTEKLTLGHPNEVAKRLDALSSLRGRFIILPHVRENGHQTLLRSGFDAHYRDFGGCGGYTDGAVPAVGTGARNILDGKDQRYGKKALAVFQTSDCRRGDFSTLGSHSTWVKWSKPTCEALRQSCLARHSRISQTAPQLPAIAITRVEISASKFLGKQNVGLSPQYNALIGGRGTGKSTFLEYARWALCALLVASERAESSPEYERRSRALIEGTLAAVQGSVRVYMDVRGVEHIVERRTASDGAKVQIKVGAEPLRPSDEDEVRRLLPVESYSQKQLSSIGGDAADVLRFVLTPVMREVATADAELARLADQLRALFARMRTSQRALEEARRLDGERLSLQKQRDALQQQFVSIDPADAAVLRSADAYALERGLRDKWQAEVTKTKEAIDALRATLSAQPTPPTVGPDAPDTDIVEKMRANLAELYGTARKGLDDAAGAFEGEAIRRFREGCSELEGRLGAARDRFKVARERSQAHESAIKAVETLSKQIGAIDQQRAALESDVSTAESARTDFNRAAEEWLARVRARGEITAARCALIEQRSRQLVRAQVRTASDLASPVQLLADAAKGSRIRTERFDGLRDYLDQQPDALGAWVSALDELLMLIGVRADDATLPPCPRLHASGFNDKELRSLAPKLDDETWMRLRLALPADRVTFDYRAREGEYIPFTQASAGQRATALMRVLLADEGVPLIVDQPEDDLDNKIIHEIASDIWQAKTRRQLIFASHNANLVVNGDADLVVVFDYLVAGEQTSGIITAEGAIDDGTVRSAIAEVMEGGQDAFKLRAEKYGF